MAVMTSYSDDLSTQSLERFGAVLGGITRHCPHIESTGGFRVCENRFDDGAALLASSTKDGECLL